MACPALLTGKDSHNGAGEAIGQWLELRGGVFVDGHFRFGAVGLILEPEALAGPLWRALNEGKLIQCYHGKVRRRTLAVTRTPTWQVFGADHR
jgi:hypothetical protein